jgi:preprotein translocase subunit YajC
MFKNILNSANESNLLPLIALVVFFLFFSFIIWNTYKMKKEVADSMSNIPLEENNNLGEV